MKTLFALVLVALVPLAGKAGDPLLSFDGGIGVDPVSGVTATGGPALNVVRGVNPGGAPWRIDKLRATVQVGGRIAVEGRGLLLSGGNGIGTTAGARVFAVLFCGPAATATAHRSSAAGVPLAANGDFSISDFITPAPPTPCSTPVLLIVSAANGRWFAAGILENDRQDD